MCVRIYVCMYFLCSMLHYCGLILHAVSIHDSFICRGCSDQHRIWWRQSLHSLYNLKQYTNKMKHAQLEIYIYIYMYLPYYNWWKSIDFVKVRNDFRCFVISSCLLTGQFPDFRTLFLKSSLCVWSSVHWLSRWSIVWYPLLQGHFACSIISNRWFFVSCHYCREDWGYVCIQFKALVRLGRNVLLWLPSYNFPILFAFFCVASSISL